MKMADRIREHADSRCVRPARVGGVKQVTIRAGDVHRGMGLSGKLPAVCSALGSNRFVDECGLRRLAVEGPLNGSNCELTFEIL